MRSSYLVAYDICDQKRLRKVHKTMREFGETLQYSVFWSSLDSMELIELKMEIGKVINHAEDSVMIVALGPTETALENRFEFFGIKPKLSQEGAIII